MVYPCSKKTKYLLGTIYPPTDNILGVDQAPKQRLVFPTLVRPRQVSRAFLSWYTPVVERPSIVVLSSKFFFPFPPVKSGKTTLFAGIRTPDYFVRF